MKNDVIVTHVRGRHASQDSLIVVESNGERKAIRNLDTRITPETTEIRLISACEGTVCLRVDDTKRHDFWMEFNLDVATLESLLAQAKQSK